MALAELIQLIAWIALLFWGTWNVNVQLERLNREVFEKAQSQVTEKLATSMGFYRIGGIVLYSPYLHPAKATFLWLFILIILFVL